MAKIDRCRYGNLPKVYDLILRWYMDTSDNTTNILNNTPKK